jgi:hypothetical protein
MVGKFYLEKIQQKQKSKIVKNERESLTDYIEYFYLDDAIAKKHTEKRFEIKHMIKHRMKTRRRQYVSCFTD